MNTLKLSTQLTSQLPKNKIIINDFFSQKIVGRLTDVQTIPNTYLDYKTFQIMVDNNFRVNITFKLSTISKLDFDYFITQ